VFRSSAQREIAIGLVLFGLLRSAAPAQITRDKPMPDAVTIHVAGNGAERVPAAIFGSFLEPIGNSINNGIAAEILVNPSLESGLWNHVNLENLFRDQPELIASTNRTGIPLPWQSLNPAAGNRFELHVGDAANSWQSLEIMGVQGQLTGIMQKVYLPVQRTLSYNVSFYGKHLSGPSTVTVSLREYDTNKVFASAAVEANGKDWTKYRVALKLSPGQVHRLEAVNFAIAVEGNERLDLDQISLMPDDAIGTLDPDAVAMAKAMNLTELRFGGNFSSSYHWRDGIGPLDKRVTMENIAWGIPEYNTFGTDEFLQLCTLIHAIPQFDLNMGSGSPEEAADWVRYIRARYKGQVLYEIGNELYGSWQVGYPALDEVAGRTLAFSKAVRSVDPQAEIIATGLGPMGGNAWNAAQLSDPPGTFNYLSLHFIYGTNHPAMPSASPDFTAAAAYAITFAAGPYFDKVQAQVDANPALRNQVHLAITEWLFNSKGEGERNFTNESPSWMNAGGAVLAGSFLNTVLRHTSAIKIADMTGMMEFAGIWKKREQVYAVPAYYVFQMYSRIKGDTILPVTTDSGAYSVAQGIRPFDNVTGIPYIDVVATRSADGKTLRLLCVNRELNLDVPIRIDLGDFVPAGRADVEQIASTNRYETNTEIEPNHVVPQPSHLPVNGSGETSYTIPHESVTVISFHSR
jgi:alpha-L-arabinofuranosidase